MLKSRISRKYLGACLAALLVIAIGCGDPIPMEEMGIAKVAIARAETVKKREVLGTEF